MATAKKVTKKAPAKKAAAKPRAKKALVLDTSDNIYTNAENKTVKSFVVWAYVGPIVGFVLGYIFNQFN